MASDLREEDLAGGRQAIFEHRDRSLQHPSSDNAPLDDQGPEPATYSKHDQALAPPLSTGRSERSASNALALQDPGQMTHRTDTARLMRRLDKHSTSLDDVRLLRAQIKSAWERFYRYRDQYVESRRLYEREIDLFTIRSTRSTDMQGIELLRRRSDSDRDQLERQCAETVGLEKQLEAKEDELQKRETAFADAANDMLLIHSPASAQEPALPSSSQSVPSLTPRLDPRLERYFDKAGDVKIMCERLLDLDQWRQETVITRELLADRGDVLPQSNEEFEEDYLRKRAIIEEEVNVVIAEADQLREACEQAGLDVTAYLQAHPEPGDDAVDSSDIDGDVPPFEVGPTLTTSAALTYPEPETDDIIDAILDGPRIRRSPTENGIEANPRVNHWVENLLFPAAADIDSNTRAQQDTWIVPEDLDLAGSTEVPSLASFPQKPTGQQILTAVADAQRSKSDTLVAVLEHERKLSGPKPYKDPGEPVKASPEPT